MIAPESYLSSFYSRSVLCDSCGLALRTGIMPSLCKAAAPAVMLCCLQEMNNFQNAKFPTTQSLEFPPFLYGMPRAPAAAARVTLSDVTLQQPRSGALVGIKGPHISHAS